MREREREKKEKKGGRKSLGRAKRKEDRKGKCSMSVKVQSQLRIAKYE